MSKLDLNDIASVTIEIKDSSIAGPYRSPLLKTGVGSTTTLYVPRYKPIYVGNNLTRQLKKYIGTDKVDDDKQKWLENAQYLFLEKSMLKTFLDKYGRGIAKGDPNTALNNALYIIKHIYFPTAIKLRYNDKMWNIKSLKNANCKLINKRLESTLLKLYKRIRLRKIREAYEKELKEATEGVTNQSGIALAKTQLDKEFAKEYEALQDYVKKYVPAKKAVVEALDERAKARERVKEITGKASATAANIKAAEEKAKNATAAYNEVDKNLRKSKNDGGYKDILDFIEKRAQEDKEQAALSCTVDLKVDVVKKIIPTKEEIRKGFATFKKSCRKNNETHSKRQEKIIESCRELCKYSKYNKWCKACSGFINCTLDPSSPIYGDEIKAASKIKAASLIAARYKGKASRKKTATLAKTKKKVKIGGRQTHRKKKKCSRRGSNP